MDCEKLINLVFSRTPLWNKFSKSYNNRDVTKNQWKEVAIEMNQPVEEVKKSGII